MSKRPLAWKMTKIITAFTSLFLILSAALTRSNPVAALQIDVPLDQALVLEGGESTNPRSFDPATTISGGDKRVFSGLVSFDPGLNVIPDLA
jgi:ABC-type transport system substrate-binding protein